MSRQPYSSPISPGYSWYEATVPDRPPFPALDGDLSADVVVIGGGFTGLSAAAHLANAGVRVIVVEACRFGDGASGRNGGQIGTGQRSWPEDMEADIGAERARALFELAEEAKRDVIDVERVHGINIDYRPGQLSVVHKPSYLKDYEAHANILASRFGYPHCTFMDGAETAERLGSTRFLGGLRDTGTGHVHPLKLLIAKARQAAEAGAQLFENSKVSAIERQSGKICVRTGNGSVLADRCLVAVNAYGGSLEPVSAAHVMPIRSFIGATVPLDDHPTVIPGGESVDDSRFVVRYFRKSADGRLLFGGREAYTADDPADIQSHLRRQIAEIYPGLGNIEITHAWGGSVGITLPRLPFAREVAPGVTSIGGFSGHGVMLSSFTGKLYAEAVSGNRERLKMFEDLDVPKFPGGRTFRKPLLTLALTWYSLVDRF
jgi:gamma-glutamylputrescine oxidase